ncbi:RTA1-like protein [Mycena maculata]|uniref:RTA1-like protein n=1 Tax=Mycena maculata TaxID=230809 RepID=A0AAD7JT05_9AGAR|nr:RTA1-like protein [Mycena maculata]
MAEDSQYGYLLQEYIPIVFVVLFGISTILHVCQATYYRMWWLFPTAYLCGIGEVVGWSGHLWSSFSPSLFDPFIMQIVCTVIAPTPLIAVNFILLSWIVSRLGPCYARLTPIRYAVLFVTYDIVALLIQAVGGGIASAATAIITYCCLACDFLVRYYINRPFKMTTGGRGILDDRVKTMIYALAFATLVLFIRSIYRIIELAGGWHGRVLHTEVYFNVLDGGMVVLAFLSFNIAHLGRLLSARRPATPVDYVAKLERIGSKAGNFTGRNATPS